MIISAASFIIVCYSHGCIEFVNLHILDFIRKKNETANRNPYTKEKKYLHMRQLVQYVWHVINLFQRLVLKKDDNQLWNIYMQKREHKRPGGLSAFTHLYFLFPKYCINFIAVQHIDPACMHTDKNVPFQHSESRV